MSEMVEKVARAICRAAGYAPDERDHLGRTFWKLYEHEAIAAIKALMEPTEDMKNCSEDIHWGYSCNVCGGLEEGWKIMLTAALDQTTPEQPSQGPGSEAAPSPE